jgi:hypothetical protein
VLISELCEKNFFSGFFKALAIQVNQRINFVQEVIWYVKFKKIFTYNYIKTRILIIKSVNIIKDKYHEI